MEKLEKKWRKIKESEDRIFAERMQRLEVERKELNLETRRRHAEMR